MESKSEATPLNDSIVDRFVKSTTLTMNDKQHLCAKLGGLTGKGFNECYELLNDNHWDIDTVINNLN